MRQKVIFSRWVGSLFCLLILLTAGARLANAQDFLPPDEAFKIQLGSADPACQKGCLLDVNVEVVPEYYLYRERFDLKNPVGVTEYSFQNLPRGLKKFDENLGMEIEALRGVFRFQIAYSLDASGVKPALEFVSQGCADAGLCYPPQSINAFDPPKVDSALSGFLNRLSSGLGTESGIGAADAGSLPGMDLPSGSSPQDDNRSPGTGGQSFGVDEAGSLANRLAGESWWFVLPVFFGLGLLLAFTPCTLPMLPIVTSLIVGQGGENAFRGNGKAGGAGDQGQDKVSAGGAGNQGQDKVSGLQRTLPRALRSVSLALVYVVGMALTYAVLGMIAGLSGQSLVVALQTPVVLWSFGGLIAVLGVALLLGYQIQMPSGLQTWIQEKTGGLKGGQFAPVLLMGILSALLLGPCVAPPLAGALLYIGQTGNALLGGLALFLLALGMGLPMVLVAAGAGTLLPKAGNWMTVVSGVFGFVMLAVALWVVQPVTDITLMYGLWVLWLVGVAAASSMVVGRNLVTSAGAGVAFRAVSILAQSMALLYLVGLFSASSTLLNPLEKVVYSRQSGGSAFLDQSRLGSSASGGVGIGLGGGSTNGGGADSLAGRPQPGAVGGHPPFENVASEDIGSLLAASTQPVMLDFYADWCVSCKEFELFTLTDPGVQNLLAGFRLVRVDVTENDIHDQQLMRRFGLFGPPAILFFQEQGFEIAAQRVVGFQNARKFSNTLKEVRTASGLPADV